MLMLLDQKSWLLKSDPSGLKCIFLAIHSMLDVLEVIRRISVDFSMNEAEPMVQRRQCAAAEKSDRIFDRKELARFCLQSNDRFDLTEVRRKDRCLLLADLSFALRRRRAGNADARAGCIKKDVKLWRLVY